MTPGSAGSAGSGVRWGIIGAGGVARGFADDLRAVSDAELVAVASRHRTNAVEFAAKFDDVTVYDTYEELVGDPRLDVVYIATPNHCHGRDALLCLRHGKAVLCEKPFAMNRSEAQEIVDEARRRELFCMEAMWTKFVPAVRRAVELVESGAIGNVTSIHADFSIDAPFDPDGRLFDPDQGGGAVLDLGVYAVTLVDMICGRPSQVTSAAVIGETSVDEQTAAVLAHGDGAIGVISAGLTSHGPNALVIAGTSGTIRLPGPICAPGAVRIERRPESTSDGSGGAGRFAAIRRRIDASGALAPAVRLGRRMLRRWRGRSATERLPVEGAGYRYEAAEVVRCLQDGTLESSLHPLDATLRVMETLDRIRDEWSGPETDHGVDAVITS